MDHVTWKDPDEYDKAEGKLAEMHISRTLKSIMRARVLLTTLSMAPRKKRKQKGRVRQKVVFECLLDVGFPD